MEAAIPLGRNGLTVEVTAGIRQPSVPRFWGFGLKSRLPVLKRQLGVKRPNAEVRPLILSRIHLDTNYPVESGDLCHSVRVVF